MQLNDNRDEQGRFKVSQSKVKSWRGCRRQWWYAHVLRLAQKRTPRPLAFGSIAHKMKEEMAKGGDPFEVLDNLPASDLEIYEDDREHYGDIVQDLKYIFESYIDFWDGRELKYLSHDGRRAEFPFELEIAKEELVVKGTIDAVTSYRKFNWLTEHKNHKNIPNDDERWRSVQSVVYIKVIQALGWWKNIEGTCWDYIRTKPPSRPELLKNGDISKRRIDTLPNVIRDLFREHKKLTGYKELVDAATLNMSTYFQRVYTPIKRQLVDKVWTDFLTTSKEMRDAKLKEPVMTIGRHCSWCNFESICRAELTGGDVDFVIEHNFVPSTYGENNEEAVSEV